MNEKILVEVYVPALNNKYDISIPKYSKVSLVTKMIAVVIANISRGAYKETDDVVLCDTYTGDIYNKNMKIDDLNLKNGSKLTLI